tara:strand:+ start:1452 stop:1778 length:327 start_codon:yes stop_codon:yes gene_type:complete
MVYDFVKDGRNVLKTTAFVFEDEEVLVLETVSNKNMLQEQITSIINPICSIVRNLDLFFFAVSIVHRVNLFLPPIFVINTVSNAHITAQKNNEENTVGEYVSIVWKPV